MATKAIDMARALLTFRDRVVNLLTGNSARLLSDGAFLLESAGGPFRVAIDGNFIIGHFASPLGGYLATKRGSDPHTGKWVAHCLRTVEALKGPFATDDLAEMLDRIRDFKPTGAERLKIEQDLRDRRRYIKRMAEVFAAVPDPDAITEGATPPLGTLITKEQEPYAKTVKAPKPVKPKPKAAKDAKPKRRGRVAKRKVS